MTVVSTPPAAIQDYAVLPNVSWEAYELLLSAFEEHPAVHLAFDRGNLEIMVPSAKHAHPNSLLSGNWRMRGDSSTTT